jgi:two-component sensor histidine kinase
VKAPLGIVDPRLLSARRWRCSQPSSDVDAVSDVNGEQIHSVVNHRLAPGATANADMRRMVVKQLRAWALEESTVQDVALTTHELVVNALVHGDPPVDLRLVHTGDNLVVEVQDRSIHRPSRRNVGMREERGRGLHVVEALALAWGVRVGAGHKTVWATHALTQRGP